jgi:hypothetical protein
MMKIFRRAGRAPRVPGATPPPRTGGTGPVPQGAAYLDNSPQPAASAPQGEPQGASGSGRMRNAKGQFATNTRKLPVATAAEAADRSPSSGTTPAA